MKSDAVFLLSKSKVIEQYNTTKKYCDVVSYSYKTNKEVVKILEDETESYFSVHSLKSVQELKYSERMLSTCTSREESGPRLIMSIVYETASPGLAAFTVFPLITTEESVLDESVIRASVLLLAGCNRA